MPHEASIPVPPPERKKKKQGPSSKPVPKGSPEKEAAWRYQFKEGGGGGGGARGRGARRARERGRPANSTAPKCRPCRRRKSGKGPPRHRFCTTVSGERRGKRETASEFLRKRTVHDSPARREKSFLGRRRGKKGESALPLLGRKGYHRGKTSFFTKEKKEEEEVGSAYSRREKRDTIQRGELLHAERKKGSQFGFEKGRNLLGGKEDVEKKRREEWSGPTPRRVLASGGREGVLSSTVYGRKKGDHLDRKRNRAALRSFRTNLRKGGKMRVLPSRGREKGTAVHSAPRKGT